MNPASRLLTVDANFPGGNIRIEQVEGYRLFVEPDLRDTEGHWFYWYFRIRNAEGQRLAVCFPRRPVMTVRGPAMSVDGGRSWKWLGLSALKDENSFEVTVPAGCTEARFSMGMPYLESNWREFVNGVGDLPTFQAGVLCLSRKGRAVETAKVGRSDGKCLDRILLTCRHHACEMMANYVLEGILTAVLRGDDGGWLRDHTEILAIPFVDKDGVEDGDQGKNRKPRDHNRDYLDHGLYPETRAIRALVPGWSAGRLRVALDLHCPWIRGGRNERLFFVGGPDPAIWEQTMRFSRLLSAVQEGPLRHDPTDNLPYGQEWNTERNFVAGRSFSRWASAIPGVILATSFEIPYADVAGVEVNPETARALGRDIARALQQFLSETERKASR